jgi:hypothetical protein
MLAPAVRPERSIADLWLQNQIKQATPWAANCPTYNADTL